MGLTSWNRLEQRAIVVRTSNDLGCDEITSWDWFVNLRNQKSHFW